MPYELVWEDRGVTIRLFGVVTADEINASNRAIFADPRFIRMEYQLADLLECTRIDVNGEQVQTIARRDADMSRSKPNVRVAIVTTMQVIYGYSRMYQICTERSTWETEIFDNVKAAREWIALPRNTLPSSQSA